MVGLLLALALPASASAGDFRLKAEIPAVTIPALPASPVPGAAAPKSIPGMDFQPQAALAAVSSAGPLQAVHPAVAAAAQPAAVAAAIAEAKSVDAALATLVQSGAVAADKVPTDETDRLFFLKRLWDHAAPAYAEGKVAVDASWAVPALEVRSGGKTFLVHPVAHGQLYPPNRRGVARLVKQIESRGDALYSEQNLPRHYGFAYGRETADHAVDAGQPLLIKPAADGAPKPAMAVYQAGRVAVLLAPLALAVHAALANPSLAAVAGAVAAALFFLVARTGLLPFYRLEKLSKARQADALNAPELAAQLRREADALVRAKPDPMDVLRLQLPPGPGAEHDAFAARSKAMAEAIAAEARDGVTHLLVGYKHAADIVWRLRSQLP